MILTQFTHKAALGSYCHLETWKSFFCILSVLYCRQIIFTVRKCKSTYEFKCSAIWKWPSSNFVICSSFSIQFLFLLHNDYFRGYVLCCLVYTLQRMNQFFAPEEVSPEEWLKILEIFILRAKISKNRQSKSWGTNLFPVVPAGKTMTSEWKLPLDKWWLSKLHLARIWPWCFKQGIRYVRLFLIIFDSSTFFPALICSEIVISFPPPAYPEYIATHPGQDYLQG